MPRRRPSRWSRRRGAMIILLAFLLAAFFVVVAICVDVAYMQLVRTELRTATDASARAAVECLSRTQSVAQAQQAARDAAQQNIVAGRAFQVANEDIVFGSSQVGVGGRYAFTPGGTPVNSCRITGRKTSDAPAGRVNLFFGGALGTPFFEPREVATASQLDRDIVLVLDRSGSMAWLLSKNSYPKNRSECTLADPTQSRWGQLVTAVQTFLAEVTKTIQSERVALVTFSTNYSACSRTVAQSQKEVLLTADYSQISSAITYRSNNIPIIGGTAIGPGLDDAVAILTDPNQARPLSAKTVILMTDGVWNAGRNPQLSAQDAAAARITVHTITYSAGANQADMKAVAQITGGNHYHAPTSDDLTKAFQSIALAVPVLLTE